jgi:hypothetical protein
MEVDPIAKCKRQSFKDVYTWGCYALYKCEPICAASLVPICFTRIDSEENVHYYVFYDNPWSENFKAQFGFKEECGDALLGLTSKDFQEMPTCSEE